MVTQRKLVRWKAEKMRYYSLGMAAVIGLLMV
jgi:hypothetical protein